jgi:predicted nucleic acid-binding protein
MRYMLDATFLIDLLRGDPGAAARLDAMYLAGDDPIVTSVTNTEIWSGVRPNGAGPVEDLLRYLEYVHVGPDAARLAGEWRASARTRGRTLGLPDALIAATAHQAGATVLTRNVRDFSLTPVRVESY